MGGCRCTFRQCDNSTSSRPGMHFFHFPVRDWPRLEIWAANAEKLEFKDLPIPKLKNKVVCEEHFKNRMFMNYLKESLVKTAVPSLEVLQDGRVYDLDTNLIGEREEWEIPEEEVRKTSSVRSGTADDPLLVPIDEENTRMEIQFLDAEEVDTGETTYSVSPVITNDTPVLLNKNANPVPIKLSLVEKPKPAVPATPPSNTILRKVVFKRKAPPSIVSPTTSSSTKKIQLLSIQKIPSQSPAKTEQPQIIVLQQDNIPHLEETQPVAIPSSSTDVEMKKSPPAPAQSLPVALPAPPPPAPAPPAPPVMDPAVLEQLERNSSEIAQLKQLLVDVLNKPIPEPQVITVPVPTPIPAPAPSSSGSSSPKPEKGPHMNKVQLFNGIKRYLNPTMVALLRVEMFGGSAERQWKADEKSLAVELVSLGENVYDHFCDEFRFRLPAKKDALKWKEQALDDDDDAS